MLLYDCFSRQKERGGDYIMPPMHPESLRMDDELSDSDTKDVNAEATASPVPDASPNIADKVALGAGCFYGVEKFIVDDFQRLYPGSIASTEVGFMSIHDNNLIAQPTYEQVCSGSSGHVQVVLVTLNNPQLNYERLLKFFFQFHDPTLKNRQGEDRGIQYASAIFFVDDEQQAIARALEGELQGLVDSEVLCCFDGRVVFTYIMPMRAFTPAATYHQRFLERDPTGYCSHRLHFKSWPSVKRGQLLDIE